jgi:hypothetical protein
MTDIINQNKIITIHPSLDIKGEVLVLGFRDRVWNEKEEKFLNFNIHLVVLPNEVKIVKDNKFEWDGITYIFEPDIENKQRRLVWLNDKWNKNLMYKAINRKLDTDNVGIYRNIKTQLKTYIVLDKEEDYEILTSWIIATYFFPIFSAFPFIWLKAMKGSGKTTSLNLIKLLSFNGVKEIPTFPSMRDKIDGQRATFLIDQADNKLGVKAYSDILDITVDSYKANSIVSKSVSTKKGFESAEFQTYSPKGFASIRELNEDLKDRCIQITLIRSKKSIPTLKEENNVWLDLRDDLYNLLIQNFTKVKEILVELEARYLESEEIVGRKLELWLPIESIMKLCKVDIETIEKVKENFLNKSKNTETTLTPLEWSIIEIILKKLDLKDEIELEVKEIHQNLPFSTLRDNEEDKEEFITTKLVGNLINRLNLFEKKKRKAGKGNTVYVFSKSKVLQVKDVYEEKVDLTSQEFTNPNTQVNINEF